MRTCTKLRTSASFTKGIEDDILSLSFRTGTHTPCSPLPAQKPCSLHSPRAALDHALPRFLGGQSARASHASHHQCDGWSDRQHPALHRGHRCLLLPASPTGCATRLLLGVNRLLNL